MGNLSFYVNSFLASGDFNHLLITFVNILESDQDRQNVSPDLDPTVKHSDSVREEESTSEGGRYIGCSLVSGVTGLFPRTYTQRTAQTWTWALHW